MAFTQKQQFVFNSISDGVSTKAVFSLATTMPNAPVVGSANGPVQGKLDSIAGLVVEQGSFLGSDPTGTGSPIGVQTVTFFTVEKAYIKGSSMYVEFHSAPPATDPDFGDSVKTVGRVTYGPVAFVGSLVYALE